MNKCMTKDIASVLERCLFLFGSSEEGEYEDGM